MGTEACCCRAEEIRPAEHFLARGQIHIFLVLNLDAFVREQSRKDFELLRGSAAFGMALRDLVPGTPFRPDPEEDATVQRGRSFSVFRGYLAKDWLFPTFFLDKSQAAPPADAGLWQAWDRFELRARLSRTGILEIKLTLPVPGPAQPETGERLIEMLATLLQVGSREAAMRPVQWELGLYAANLFISALPADLVLETASRKVVIGLHAHAPATQELPPRLRYTVLFFNTISCARCGRRIAARTLWRRDRKVVCALLEGALIRTREGVFVFPELDREAQRKYEDLATWEDELCVFTPERCLIYHPPEQIVLPGQEGVIGPVKYESYWKCIVRGIEHTASVRTALQILESYTTRELDQVPLLTRKITDGSISLADEHHIMEMADEIASTFNILPGLRNILVPTNAFRASFAVNKFRYLNEILLLQEVLGHIQRNVDELVIFLNHFTNVQLQAELQRGESAINKIGLVVALISMIAAGPSFMEDFTAFFGARFGWPSRVSIAAFVLIGAGMIAIITLIYLRFALRLYRRARLRRMRARVLRHAET